MQGHLFDRSSRLGYNTCSRQMGMQVGSTCCLLVGRRYQSSHGAVGRSVRRVAPNCDNNGVNGLYSAAVRCVM
jgi:hypothetical protein